MPIFYEREFQIDSQIWPTQGVPHELQFGSNNHVLHFLRHDMTLDMMIVTSQ